MQSVRSLLWIILDIIGYQTICYSSERGTHSDRNSGPDLCQGGSRVQTLTRIRMHGAFSAIAERLVLLILTTKGTQFREIQLSNSRSINQHDVMRFGFYMIVHFLWVRFN